MTELMIQQEIAQQALSLVSNMDHAEKELLQMPQADCPVVHHFGPNICVREVSMPAGTLAIGHKQKFEHLNMMLKGKVMIVKDDGSTEILTAPLMFVGKPGRKIGCILEDTIWQNIYSTDLKTSNEVEDFFIEKSEDWQQDQQTKFCVEQASRELDRIDYFLVLEQFGISHETALSQSIDTSDQIFVQSGITKVDLSPIDGKGLFATFPIKSGSLICNARINGMRTQAGRYTNHSSSPNAKMVLLENGDIDLIAIRDINGCKGGNSGEEITIDYRQALLLSIERKEELCLE